MQEEREKSDYEIGYGRPPLHTRFPKGSSGNPKGRPRRAKSAATLVRSALRERITVRENGRVKRITKLDAIIRQLVNKALNSDYRAIEFLFDKFSPLDKDPAEQRKPGGLSKEAVEAIRRAMRGDPYPADHWQHPTQASAKPLGPGPLPGEQRSPTSDRPSPMRQNESSN
jgi:hypothetical protein